MGERMLDRDTVTGDRLMSAGWVGECWIGTLWRCWMAGRQLHERTLTMQDGRESAGLGYGGGGRQLGERKMGGIGTLWRCWTGDSWMSAKWRCWTGGRVLDWDTGRVLD
jgi:hypothetical protein